MLDAAMPTIEDLLRENARLRAENGQLHTELRFMRQKVDALIRRVYGAKSEVFHPDQLTLLDVPTEEAPPASAHEPLAEAPAKRRKAARSKKPRALRDLEVVEERLEPEEVRVAPAQWRQIRQEYSDQLDYRPGAVFTRRLVRPVYVHRFDPDRAPVIAPLPARLLDRGTLAPGLLAQVAIAKYADHMPLYRQERMFEQRHGVYLPRQTLAQGVKLVAEWCEPIVRAMRDELFKGAYVQIDETPIRYLAPGQGRCAQGYLWTTHRPGADTVFDWFEGRGHECLNRIVPESFKGRLQSDGYSAYRAFVRTREGIESLGCWAHARRKFFESAQLGDEAGRSRWVLGQIGHLYGIEKCLRESRAGPALREAVRWAESHMLVNRLYRALMRFRLSTRFKPSSAFGKAVDYALRQEPALRRCFEQGHVEIDNNLVENAIRPSAVGKKNWLFFGSKHAGKHAAILYTLIVSCRQRGIDPHAYLKDILERLPTMTNHQVASLTPAAWAQAQPQATLRQAA